MSRIAVLAHALYAVREPYEGGLEMHTAMLCAQLAASGHEVVLFAKGGSQSDGFDVEEIFPHDQKFIAYPLGSPDARRQLDVRRQVYLRTIERIEQQGFDFIINNTMSAGPLMSDTALPMLSIFHTPPFPEMEEGTAAAVSKRNRIFATVSATNAANWRHLVPQVQVVHNGVDLNTWVPSGAPTDELRWCARITEQKGTHVAIEAALLAGRRIQLAGPISEIEYFEAMVKPKLSNNVEYVGHLLHHELPSFFNEGAVFVATPMWEEPFGLSIVEAMACGTPTAALPRGAMHELITDDVGAVAEESTPEALAKAIEVAATKDRTSCRARAESNFDVRSMVNAYVRLMEASS